MEIELYSKLNDPILAIEKVGSFFSKSGMFGCDRQEQGQVLAMVCMVEKKSPTEILNNYDIIDGKLRRKAMSALGTFRMRGGKHKWLKTGDDGKEAEIELTYDGQTLRSRYTIEEAKAQGLIRPRSNWEKTPGNMLRARAASNGIAMIAPEIYSGEEPSEFEPAAPTEKPGISLAAPVVTVGAPVAPAETPRPSNVVDIAATVTPQEVTTTPAEQPKTFAAGPTYAPPANASELANEMQAQLLEAIGQENIVKAITWMRKEGWLLDGQGLEHLTEARARRVIKQRDGFRSKLAEVQS